jgi:hypothetical protein
MRAKLKNRIVFIFQLQFFITLTVVTVFLEFVWVYEIYFYPLNFYFPIPPSQPTMPSIPQIIISITFALFVILNTIMAIFSIYAFVFVLHVLDSNPAKTAPVCAIAIDVALINFFFYQLCIFREQFFIYFMIPNLMSQISIILMIIAFFSIFINLQFGIEGIMKRHVINSNKMTNLIHYILIINGIIGISFVYTYIIMLKIGIIEFTISVSIAIVLIGLFNFVLRKLKVNNYPIEALSRWKYGMVITKKDEVKAKS